MLNFLANLPQRMPAMTWWDVLDIAIVSVAIYEILKATLAAVPVDVPVIADAKRGDIGNTSAAYARAIFEDLGADAMTVNAYGGKDAVVAFNKTSLGPYSKSAGMKIDIHDESGAGDFSVARFAVRAVRRLRRPGRGR